MTEYGINIAQIVKQGTGIPVSVGIAPTKTLAKLANKIVMKGIDGKQSVLNWTMLTDPDHLMSQIPVKDIWGISSGWGKKLENLDIDNAIKLKRSNPKWIRQHFGVVMERNVSELNGNACIPLDMITPARKQILTSRSFGERLTQLTDLRAAVSAFASRSAEKLRQQNLCTQALCVFIHTSPFDLSKPVYNNAITIELNQATQDTGLLIRSALSGLSKIFRAGYHYQRAGVLLPDLVPNGVNQLSLFLDDNDLHHKSDKLMAMIDTINRTQGRNSLRYASDSLSSKWQMRQNMRTPAYTTKWECLPFVIC